MAPPSTRVRGLRGSRASPVKATAAIGGPRASGNSKGIPQQGRRQLREEHARDAACGASRRDDGSPARSNLAWIPTATALTMAGMLACGGGGGGGGMNRGGGGGGGGGGDGSNGRHLWDSPAHAEEDAGDGVAEEEVDEDVDEVAGEDDNVVAVDTKKSKAGFELGETFRCKEVVVLNEPDVEGLPSVESMVSGFEAKKGGSTTRKALKKDVDRIMQTGLFENVKVSIEGVAPGVGRVTYDLAERQMSPCYDVRFSGATALDDEVKDAITKKLKGASQMTPALVGWTKNKIDAWYRDKGLAFGCVSHFEGLDSGSVTVQCFEGVISDIKVFYESKGGKRTSKGSYPQAWIWKAMPFKLGNHYSLEDGKRALRNLFSMDLFENVQVTPTLKKVEEDPTQREIVVEVNLLEKPIKTTELQLEWGLGPGEKGRPVISSVVPSGEIFAEHKNVDGRGSQISGSLTSSDLLVPTNDIGFKVEYKKPFCKGVNDPNKTTLIASAFSTRKQSVVFTPGSGDEEVPVIYVTRTGARIGLHESHSRNSKANYSFVAQNVQSHDESGALCTNGSRRLPNGTFKADGPPTTLSDTGSDSLGFMQFSLVRDTTYFQGGSPIGSRDQVQVDQGLGIGSCFPFFNRHVLSSTRFIPIGKRPESTSEPQASLILSTKYGNSFGDLPTYEAFALGGPHSVRAYGMGELAICRSFLVCAAEARVPVAGRYVYGFYEQGTDLGSSKLVRGNPTECYRKPGSGSTYGAGVKLGIVKMEYARDCNANKGHLFFRFGERF